MKVKIIKSTGSNMWYTNKIGNIYEVKEVRNTTFRIIDEENDYADILKDDCEVLGEI